jgi:hypothetical protein
MGFYCELECSQSSDYAVSSFNRYGRRGNPSAPYFQALQIQLLHLLPRPFGLAQKSQTGFDGRIIGKTVDPDQISQLRPAVKFDQLCQDHFQRFTVKGIIFLRFYHPLSFFPIQYYTELHRKALSYKEKMINQPKIYICCYNQFTNSFA